MFAKFLSEADTLDQNSIYPKLSGKTKISKNYRDWNQCFAKFNGIKLKESLDIDNAKLDPFVYFLWPVRKFGKILISPHPSTRHDIYSSNLEQGTLYCSIDNM